MVGTVTAFDGFNRDAVAQITERSSVAAKSPMTVSMTYRRHRGQ